MEDKKITAQKVGCQGIAGAYAHLAAQFLYPEAAISFYKTWEQVFQAVESGDIERGILPIENSSTGSVSEVYDLLVKYRLSIAEGCRMDIKHHLLVKPGLALTGIKKVLSHAQGLHQCEKFLEKYLPHAELITVGNTAEAAKLAAQGEDGLAAIASAECAKLYGLTILQSGLAPRYNCTRFIAISKETIILPNADKISLIFSLPHKQGSLYEVLGYFAKAGLNLTKIESRPIEDSPFEYHFYLDFAGYLTSSVQDFMQELLKVLPTLRFLGNYPEYICQ